LSELQPAIDAEYYRRAVQFREDMFVFFGPEKAGRYFYCLGAIVLCLFSHLHFVGLQYVCVMQLNRDSTL